VCASIGTEDFNCYYLSLLLFSEYRYAKIISVI